MENKVKFSTQVEGEILSHIKNLAKQEGRQLQAIVEEAFRDLLEKRNTSKARKHVMAQYNASHEKFGPLFEKLAK